MSDADIDIVRRCEGLFVGQLTTEESAAFARLCMAGVARRSYEHVSGFMGLAKVRIAEPEA